MQYKQELFFERISKYQELVGELEKRQKHEHTLAESEGQISVPVEERSDLKTGIAALEQRYREPENTLDPFRLVKAHAAARANRR